MSLNFLISPLVYLEHSPMHRHRLRQSGAEYVREWCCEIQKTGKVHLLNNVPYNVQECPQSESNSKLNILLRLHWFVFSITKSMLYRYIELKFIRQGSTCLFLFDIFNI